MSPGIIRECLGAEPFIPFSMLLTDQREIQIDRPEGAKVTDDDLAVLVTQTGGRLIVSLGHVVSVHLDRRGGGIFGFGS